MTNLMHVREKKTGAILERFAVDAFEIVRVDPENYELVGRVPASSPGTTSAVLDNDPPTEVARKILEAAGVKPVVPEGTSEEAATQDVHGNEVTAAGSPDAKAEKAAAKQAAKDAKAAEKAAAKDAAK